MAVEMAVDNNWVNIYNGWIINWSGLLITNCVTTAKAFGNCDYKGNSHVPDSYLTQCIIYCNIRKVENWIQGDGKPVQDGGKLVQGGGKLVQEAGKPADRPTVRRTDRPTGRPIDRPTEDRPTHVTGLIIVRRAVRPNAAKTLSVGGRWVFGRTMKGRLNGTLWVGEDYDCANERPSEMW